MNATTLDLAALVRAQLWQVTIVALVLGMVARFACRRWPHLAYLLWMLVVIKALTPPMVASPTGLFSWMLRETSPAPLATVAAPPRALPVPAVNLDFPDVPNAE